MEKKLTSEEVTRALHLEPLLREGGMFRSTYSQMAPDQSHVLSNAIYYLLQKGQFSHLHRLNHDEIYHYHLGDPLELIEIRPDGTCERFLCGPDVLNGQVPQVTIHAGCWQGSRVAKGGEFCLVGTVSIPGWTPEGYEHCEDCEPLVQQHPQWEELIRNLCRDVSTQFKTEKA